MYAAFLVLLVVFLFVCFLYFFFSCGCLRFLKFAKHVNAMKLCWIGVCKGMQWSELPLGGLKNAMLICLWQRMHLSFNGLKCVPGLQGVLRNTALRKSVLVSKMKKLRQLIMEIDDEEIMKET